MRTEDEKKDRAGRTVSGLLGALMSSTLGDFAVFGANKMSDKARRPQFPGNTQGAPLLSVLPAQAGGAEALDRQKLIREVMRTGTRPSMTVGRRDVAQFIPGEPPRVEVSSPTTASAFHEIGHVASESPFSLALRKHTQPRLNTLLTKDPEVPTIGDGLRIGFLMGAVAHPSDEHPVAKFVHDNAAVLTGLTELPTLMSELRASYSALKGMHAQGGAAGVKGGLKLLAPALAGYLASAGGRVGGVALARRLSRPATEKKAAAMPTLGVAKMPAPPKVTGQLRLSTMAANKTPVGQLKPKTTPPHPGNRQGNFPGIATAKPPSLTGYYKDSLDSMDAPGRGTRT